MMKQEKMKDKLKVFCKELGMAKEMVDEYTVHYVNCLEVSVFELLKKLDLNELKPSDGGGLGFRRAILEYDDLAEIDSLYVAACEVDSFYGNECQSWN